METKKINYSSEELLSSAFDVLNMMEESILIANRDTKIIFVNNSYFNTYGESYTQTQNISIDGIIGTDLSKLDDSAGDVALMKKVMKTGRPECAFYSTSDESHPVLADLYPLKNGEKVIGIVSVIKNVSHIIQMHQQVNKYKNLAEELQEALDIKENLPSAFHGIIGRSQPLVEVLHQAAKVALTSASVCILGETGTGKENIAEAIHYASNFSNGPLIKVNCAAIPESMFESELFGYVAGAFTGANPKGSPGKFELANGGTLFLDEIGEMPLSMQVKLLRTLQDKSITRLGSSKVINLKFRLITATNRNLIKMVQDNEFREDLFYRINVISLTLPPLRKRKQDIPRLANFFLGEMNNELYCSKQFSPEVINGFLQYDWPGNIRELKNCVERMAVLSSDDSIDISLLPFFQSKSKEEVKKNINCSESTDKDFSLQNVLDKAEKEALILALKQTNGNKSKAIKLLNTSRQNFYIKLEKYGL